jgi:hypothetical protein
MVFVLVGNDFDLDHPGALVRSDYSPSLVKRVARHSALCRYLFVNLGFHPAGLLAAMGGNDSTSFVGNTRARIGPERHAASLGAIDEFFRQLPKRTGLDTARILIVLDGMRLSLYSAPTLTAAQDSYFSRMRRAVTDRVQHRHRSRRHAVGFRPTFRRARPALEYEIDGHWNALGHRLVAEAISRSNVVTREFPQ